MWLAECLYKDRIVAASDAFRYCNREEPGHEMCYPSKSRLKLARVLINVFLQFEMLMHCVNL